MFFLPSWFAKRALEDDIPSWIKELSKGPNVVAKRFSAYLVNGYRFHTRLRDGRRKTQNSGVTVMALTTSFASAKDKNPITTNITYYGRIIEIVELDYYGHFKVVLFRCEWYIAEQDTYGLTYVYFNKTCYQEEPFVLASQAHQCFYVQDPYDLDKHFVMKTIPRDLFNIGDQLEYVSHQFYDNEPHEYSSGLMLPNDPDDEDLVRKDVPATIVDKEAHIFSDQQHKSSSEEEFSSDDEMELEYDNTY